MKYTNILLIIALIALASAQSNAAKSNVKVLVLLDSLDLQSSHSKFLQTVRSKGYDVTVASVDSKSLRLQEWDSWLFDKLIIFGGKNELGDGLKPEIIKDFSNSGRDVILALSTDASSQMKNIAKSFGVRVDSRNKVVIDHFNFDSKLDSGDHTTIISSNVVALPSVFTSKSKGPVLYKGLGLSLPSDTEIAFFAITGAPTSYSGPINKPATGKVIAGQSLGLVALVQGRNNARITVIGSTDFFSDAFLRASTANNSPVTNDLLQWGFSEKSVLKSSSLRHRIVGGEESPARYRVSDDVVVEVDINECTNGECKPYAARDVQIEFTMLDPHIRTTLNPLGNGTFQAKLKVPDVYGVFKWVLEYRRLGYTWISEVQVVPVRPFRHDEYERFIVQAYPYYLSVMSMMAGFFVLGLVFMSSKKYEVVMGDQGAAEMNKNEFTRAFSKASSNFAAYFVLFVGWIHSAIINPIGEWMSGNVLKTFEETTKSIVRGWFNVGGRYIHTFSAACISIFSRQSYSRQHHRATAARAKAWDSWWTDVAARGSFNALIEDMIAPVADTKYDHNIDQGKDHAVPSTRPAPTSSHQTKPNQMNTPKQRLTTKTSNQTIRHNTKKTPSTTTRSRLASLFYRRPSTLHISKTISGSHLFSTPAQTLTEQVAQRGLLEDIRMAVDVGISAIFSYLQRAIRYLFLMETSQFSAPALKKDTPRRKWKDQHVFTASDAILLAGYPLEEHSVTTSDGYVLSMHRIPRRGGRDVVLFQHGVLDTSLGWVANGPGGSVAFSAFDAGFDVWLLNTRANPPRLNVKPEKQGARYWKYSVNDLAMNDMPAQINYIHRMKMAELKGGVGNYSSVYNSISVAERGNNNGERLEGMKREGREGAKNEKIGRTGKGTFALGRSLSQSILYTNDIDNDGGVDFDTGNEIDNETHDQHTFDAESYDNSAGGELHRMHIDQHQPLRRAHSESLHFESLSPARFIDNDGDEEIKGKETSIPIDDEAMHSTTTGAASNEALPYRLQAVGHSLGAASLLMYAVACRMSGQPHRLRRLILLSPAGFHIKIPLLIRPCVWIMPAAVSLMNLVRPRAGVGLRLPSPLLRWVTFKLVADIQRSPAMLDLMKASLRVATGGDASAWDKALSLPHYSVQSMPAVSLHTGNHFAQWARYPEFRMYDYGSVEKNKDHYGVEIPPSIAKNYGLLKDISVDLIAGTQDGLVTPENVQAHLKWLRKAEVKGDYREYAYGHLAFTFGVRDEVVSFVMSRLRQTSFL